MSALVQARGADLPLVEMWLVTCRFLPGDVQCGTGNKETFEVNVLNSIAIELSVVTNLSKQTNRIE